MLYIDVETEPTRHDVVLPRPVVVAVALGDGPVELVEPARAVDMIKALGGPVIGHRVAFDLAVLGLSLAPHRVYDTNVRAVLRGAAEGDAGIAGYSLHDLARKVGINLTGKGTTQLSFTGTFAELTPEQRRYAAQDTEATRAVFKAQGGLERLPDEERQTASTHHVFRMARRGLRVDRERVLELRAQNLVASVRLESQLREAGIVRYTGPRKDPRRSSAVDTRKVRELLAAEGHTARTEPTERFPEGQLKADTDTLEAAEHPALQLLAEYKALEKELGLIEALDTGCDWIRANYKPLVITGRMACSGPNLQQIPKKGGLRECIVPTPGNSLVVADFHALEIHTFADTCVRWGIPSTMAKLLNEGVDVHDYFAERGAGTRAVAKVLNFGCLGGMGPRTLAAALPGKALWQVKGIHTAWKKTFPELSGYWERCTRELVDYANVRGRKVPRYRVQLPWSGRTRVGFYSEVANTPFQGAGADVMREALTLCEVAKLPVVAGIHDELILDTPVPEIHGPLLVECMASAQEAVCPNVPARGGKRGVFATYPERWASK